MTPRGVDGKIMQHVVDDRDQGIVRHLDARGARALVQGLVEFVGQAGVGAQPAFAGRIRQVEVQPDELPGHGRTQPGGSVLRVDRRRRAAFQQEAPHQPRDVGAVVERRCRHHPSHRDFW
jgi:hypothetical protein